MVAADPWRNDPTRLVPASSILFMNIHFRLQSRMLKAQQLCPTGLNMTHRCPVGNILIGIDTFYFFFFCIS